MVNLKTPLLSLGASGSIGNSISFVKRRGQKIAEKKPHLPYFLTLPVQYQRWLYEDYCYLWHAQTAATKATYRSAGVRFHLTAFQYWMKYNLANLPDIAAWWKLDARSDAIAVDSSRNENNGVVIGAIERELAIGQALYFDGLNDTVSVPSDSSLDVTDNLTIECFFKLLSTGGAQYFFLTGVFNTTGVLIYIPDGRSIEFYTSQAAANQRTNTAPGTFQWDTLYHLAITLALPDVFIFLDGVDVTAVHRVHLRPASTDLATFISSRVGVASWAKGTIDNLIFYSRVLDHPTILRHSLRRYLL